MRIEVESQKHIWKLSRRKFAANTIINAQSLFFVSRNIQKRITTFYRNLPPTLAFHEENMKLHADEGNGSLLVLLHLSFHGSNMVVHWPSLFKEFAAPVSHSVDIAYAVSIYFYYFVRRTKLIGSFSHL
jgi:hypothetical protein